MAMVAMTPDEMDMVCVALTELEPYLSADERVTLYALRYRVNKARANEALRNTYGSTQRGGSHDG